MRLALLAAVLLQVCCPPTWAQDAEAASDNVFDRGCGDDDGNDRCAADVQRRMRELYGLADVESLAQQGVTLRRAMFVDGYGNDVVAVTFGREPGRPPMVEIETPHREDAPGPQALSAAISREVWDRVLTASQNFDRRLEDEWSPRQADRNGELRICLHGWFVVAEAADAQRMSQNIVGQHVERGRARRDAEGACADGMAVPFAFELAKMALASLPECGSLDAGEFRNEPVILATCHRLGGDRLAAGDAMRLVNKLSGNNSRMPQGREFGWLFAESAKALEEPFRAAVTHGNAALYFDPPYATDVDHATAQGQIVFWGEGGADGEDDEQADIRLQLVRQLGEFVIQSYEISERRPFP